MVYGAIVFAILSGVVAALLVRKVGRLIAWVLSVLGSLFGSYCLYWWPVWSGASADASEYFLWEPLLVGAWFLAGAASSSAVVWILGRRVVSRSRSNV
jgi:hypothetical protein